MHRPAIFAAATVILAGLCAAGKPPADPLAPIGLGPRPAPPPAVPVTETIWGTKVTDRYRNLEAMDPGTVAWFKQQGAYTRRVLDAIAPRAALQKRVAAFTGSFGVVEDFAIYGGRSFYRERRPGADDFNLVVRDAGGGTRTLVDIAALRAHDGGKPYAINYILPSPDGTKVAVGISAGGSEDAAISVYDAATGAVIAGPVDRAQFGPTSWSADSRVLYFIRLKALGPKDPGTEKYRDPALDAWTLNAPPTPLYGARVGGGPGFGPDETPELLVSPDPKVPVAVLVSQNGVQNEWKLWTAPVAQAGRPNAPWTLLADRDAGITSLDARGDTLFLLSHKDAPTFQVLQLKAGQTLAEARVLVPAAPSRVVESVHAAADALYVTVTEGVYSHLLRIPAGSSELQEVGLPFTGHISVLFADPRRSGVVLSLENMVTPPTTLRYDPASRSFTDLHLGQSGDIRPADFVVRDLDAPARDGVKVPLSLVQPAHATGPQITVIEAYGSYGISELADFSARRAAAVKEGITYGVCHVRGGGERGEAWRLGGKDANKPNTWRDLIACADDLVGRGITRPDRLFIIGGSAGGITMGRAMEERPELFAGVIDLVPAANTLRAEFSPNGPDNIPEFGTIKTKQGFADLLAMDSVTHVEPGVAYPAVMITTGLNDPRVSSWEPGKLAATLDAAGGPNPVLLRVDTEAGHGIGQTRAQGDALIADWMAFMFWRSGRPGWRPEAQTH